MHDNQSSARWATDILEMNLTELLAYSEKQGGSDLHLSSGLPPMIRIDGDIRRINLPVLDREKVRELINEDHE